ncbi:hypothetical protein C8R43DRAFT_1171962 [Mycena crocata]|nr:hypothetical protein C8R43DRAFT_1171962 [Mycena crocata]
MKLADEQDKEFQQKYSTDLDTSLIFAGLFSAVSSAFIIQIQPQLSEAPTFIHNAASSPACCPRQAMDQYYQAAGSRGTIEERGLKRQRKLDGLRRWKFDTVLQMFPLLLQLALFLFASALSVYLWTINHAIAIIVLTITAFGFASYLFLLLAACISPDSPFQSPIAAFLIQKISPLLRVLVSKFDVVQESVSEVWTRFSQSRVDILPCFRPQPSRSQEDETSFLDALPNNPSPEVPAVLWVLETSTDPMIIGAAAEIVVDLQWPLDLEVRSPLFRIGITLASCFDHQRVDDNWIQQVRDGLTKRALHCAKAYCILRGIVWAADPNFSDDIFYFGEELIPTDSDDPADFKQLVNACRIVDGWPELTQTSQPLEASHIIPSLYHRRNPDTFETRMAHFLAQFQPGPILDDHAFANYLYYINAFLGHMTPQLMVQKDKRSLQGPLMAHLFKALRHVDMDASLVGDIIRTTAELYKTTIAEDFGYRSEIMKEMLEFCSHFYRLNRTLNVLALAATLAHLPNPWDFDRYQRRLNQRLHKTMPEDIEWIYAALEHVQQSSEESGKEFQDQAK